MTTTMTMTMTMKMNDDDYDDDDDDGYGPVLVVNDSGAVIVWDNCNSGMEHSPAGQSCVKQLLKTCDVWLLPLQAP